MSKPRVCSQFRNSTIILIILAVLALLAAVAAAVFHWPGADFAFPGDPVTDPGNRDPATGPGIIEPFWPEPVYIARPRHVKGIYVIPETLQTERFNELVVLVKETELNAMVIDLKDDEGRLTYNRSIVPWAEESGATGHYDLDPVELIALLAEHNIYPIARIVAFKDSTMAAHRPDLALVRKDGGLWYGDAGYWLDPYNKESWKYIVAIAREAAEIGFREIQFDYVRFPSRGNLMNIDYRYRDGTAFNEVIPAFLRYAKASLAEYNVEISADIFGLVPVDPTGMGIGQHFESIAAEVDLVCPMVYPCLYGPGSLGLPDPEGAPYDTVYRTLEAGLYRLQAAGLDAYIRPWLQSYTHDHYGAGIRHPYRAAEVRAQIQAAEDLGIHEFLLWGIYFNPAALRGPDKE